MSNERRGRLETAVNVAAVVLVACAVGIVLVRYHAYKESTRELWAADTLAVDFSKAPRTLIIVVKQGCSFCDRSLRFYRDAILTVRSSGARVQVVVAVPRKDSGTAAYLASAGVKPDSVVHFSRGDLPVRLIPTIAILRSDRTLIAGWEGALSVAEEGIVKKMLLESE